jgi:hypothetical protein
MVTVIETFSKLYIIEYIVVFWLNDILVTTTTPRDGSDQIFRCDTKCAYYALVGSSTD